MIFFFEELALGKVTGYAFFNYKILFCFSEGQRTLTLLMEFLLICWIEL